MAERFVKVVRDYLTLVDGLPGLTAIEFLSQCAILVPQIYALSQQLPDIELTDDEVSEESEDEPEPPMGKIHTLLGKYDLYAEVFDPVFDEAALKTTISDDLSDIYTDLKRHLSKYDSGDEHKQRIAIWEWKFHMKIHWGHHAVGVLRPIHSLVHDHLDPEFHDEESNTLES
ncbi:MAG TPA: DUF5063 domain-containing protein [Blastocatellia bacterium]|nr:DUF5063 domain-containing protein [Blastocatellia bacterium]